MRVRLLVAYRGDAFHGWQIQRGSEVRTVEGTLTEAVATMTRARRKVWGASRTDAGVHAWGQVAAFDVDEARDPWTYLRGLNALTPDELCVRGVDIVPTMFHPRHSARGKIYHYRIATTPYRSPFDLGRATFEHRGLDVCAMHEAAQQLIGEHDFSSFRAAGCDASSPVRSLHEVSVRSVGPKHVRVRVVGTAFLKYMVRNIVGSLLEVGLGRRDGGWLGDVLRARDRSAAGPTAPPNGLTLVRVFHPDFPWGGGVGDTPDSSGPS